MSRTLSPRLRRALPPLALLAAYAIFALLYLAGFHDLYKSILTAIGFDAWSYPFLDAHGTIATIDCHRLGFDVLAEDPCDELGRVQNYSPLWLVLAATPVTGSWTPAVGLVMGLLFIATLWFLPTARGGWALAIILCATLSTDVAYALERANVDLIMFLLAFAAGTLALRTLPARLLAYPPIVLGACLKFYPAALIILTLRERTAMFLASAAAILAALAAFVLIETERLRRTVALIPDGLYFFDRFGATNLPFGLQEMGLLPIPRAAELLLIAALAATAIGLARSPALPAALARLTPAEDVFLMIGATLLAGCFLTAQNINYRGIYMLFLLPGLTALRETAPTKPWRRLFAAGAVVAVLLMWEGATRYPMQLDVAELRSPAWAFLVWHARQVQWLLRELAWWCFATLLCAILLAQVARTPIGAALLKALPANAPLKPQSPP